MENNQLTQIAEHQPSSSQNKTMVVNMAMYEAVSTRETEDKKGWVTYGADNAYPNYLIDLYYSAPYHNALCNAIASMIVGDGLYATGAGSIQLSMWGTSKHIDNVCSDLKIQGGFYLEIILTADKKGVARVNHLPFENCRVSYSEETDKINGVWYSRDWKNTTKKQNKPVLIPLFTKLPSENEEDAPVRYAVYNFRQAVGSMYYPKPDYIGGLNYIELSRQIGLYHVNNIMNGFFPSIIVQFNNGQPDGNGADLMTRDFENKMSGARNAGKAIFLFNDNKDVAATFETFPLSDADKQYEYLSTQSVEATMVSHGVTTPLLFGVKNPNGFSSNADEMEQGLEIFMEKRIEPYRRMIAETIEYIMQVAGIDTKITFVDPLKQVSLQKKKVNLEIPDSFEPTNEMAAEAELGLKWREEFGRGGTEVGVARARDISNKRNLSYDTVKRMNSYFSRHEVDKEANGWNDGEDGFPTAGRIAWQLWGGDAGRDWASRIVERHREEELHSVCCSTHQSDFDDDKAIDYLKTVAEQIDLDEWEEYDEDIIVPAFDTIEEENEYLRKLSEKVTSMANPGEFVKPDDYSKWGDTGLYKLRYSYSQNISQDSRQFCKQMVALAQVGKVFRYEDIIAMGRAGVNKDFAPEGEKTYNIFEWKGGVYCHHKWERRIYFRKREGGKFLPNDGLKNDVRVANVPFVPQKGVEGVAPINTPTRGSLKYA